MKPDILDQLAEALAARQGLKHNATGTPTTVYAHGQDSNAAGLFSYPGVEPDVFSTVMMPELGVWDRLVKTGSIYTDPIFQTITGVRADVGDEPTEVCGASPVAGYLKGCKLTAPFGRYRRQTREIYIDRIGMYINRGDPNYLRAVNLANPEGMPPFAAGDPLRSEKNKIMFEWGTSMRALLGRQVFIGDPANNNGEAYKEYPGLDLLITTGHVDAETNTSCPSLDSDIKDFDFGLVDAVNSQIIDYLFAMARYLKRNAEMMRLTPVNWGIAMRYDLFTELATVWPCRYLSYRCQSWRDTNGLDPVGQYDSAAAVRMRDDMINGRYLLIDGAQWPVIIDDGIPEDSSDTNGNLQDGQFASDIYFIPFTVLGGTPATYAEYFNHENADIQQVLGEGRVGGANGVWTEGNGAWIFTVERTRLCVFWEGKIEPRIVLRTPQLAGRITNVAYEPLQHVRQPFPADGYFVNGGQTYRSAGSLYTSWGNR